MDKTEIYYFSGTGNSLHVAQELHKRIPNSEIIPMVSLLDKEFIETKSKTVGFVFPTYLTTVPAPVRMFFKKIDTKSATYTFSIVTRMGSFCVANRNVKRLLAKKGKRLDARFLLNMASNSPTGLKPGKGDENWVHDISKDRISKLESEIQPRLDDIKKIIANRDKYPQKRSLNLLIPLVERIMYLITRNIKTQINFITDSTCTGCGICEKVCLSGKIKMKNKKPEWQKDVSCFYCYACFNFCPNQAILVDKKYTKKDGRYFHPDITADDIAKQKVKI